MLIESVELNTEAGARRFFCKKLLLKISQNSQKNTCTKVSFLVKLPVTLLKRGSGKAFFLRIMRIFFLRTAFFIDHIWWRNECRVGRDQN